MSALFLWTWREDGADWCRLGLSDYLMGKVVERLRELETKATD